MAEFDVVTGAFSYSGRYIAQRLLSIGRAVKTLTRHPGRPNPFGNRVQAASLNFADFRGLVESLRGATILYNTYWVRFSHGNVTFERAVANSGNLIRAAKEAGVRRIVHLSVSNPSEDSPFPYFRGKAAVERMIRESGLSYAIIRPTVVYGGEDILINNIAWLLRRFPLFPVAGTGQYRLQPVFVEDMAELAVEAGQRNDNAILNAAGPEIYTFESLVRLIASRVRSRAAIVHVHPRFLNLLSQVTGYVVNDVLLTKDELGALMANLLDPGGPPTVRGSFSEWLARNADALGRQYASELERHFR